MRAYRQPYLQPRPMRATHDTQPNLTTLFMHASKKRMLIIESKLAPFINITSHEKDIELNISMARSAPPHHHAPLAEAIAIGEIKKRRLLEPPMLYRWGTLSIFYQSAAPYQQFLPYTDDWCISDFRFSINFGLRYATSNTASYQQIRSLNRHQFKCFLCVSIDSDTAN